jgi:hypothetical protein
MSLTAPVTIDSGVTVTVAAGTTVSLAAEAGITIDGTLDASAGTKASPIIFQPATGVNNFVRTTVSAGGMMIYSYVTQVGGGFDVSGDVTVTDSQLSNAAGLTGGPEDFIVINAGTYNMQYSQIGLGAPNDASAGSGDTTHCNFHVNAVSELTVNYSNIDGSPYGLMLYAPTSGSAANLQNNNFYNNQYDFEPGEGGLGDVTGSWFKSGTITAGATGISGALGSAALTAGPR